MYKLEFKLSLKTASLRPKFKAYSAQLVLLFMLITPFGMTADGRVNVNAAYIPFADQYAALVTYEKYRGDINLAEFNITRMKKWPGHD